MTEKDKFLKSSSKALDKRHWFHFVPHCLERCFPLQNCYSEGNAMLYWYLKNLPRERDQCRECRVSFALVSNLIKFAINVVSRRRCEPLLIKLVIPLYVLLSPFSYVAKAPLVLALNRENSTGLIPTFQYIRAGERTGLLARGKMSADLSLMFLHCSWSWAAVFTCRGNSVETRPR